VGRFFWWNTFEIQTVVLNLIWTVYNLIIIGASLAVSLESRQVRNTHRVDLQIPASLRFDGGRTMVCTTRNISSTGIGLDVPDGLMVEPQTSVQLSLFLGDSECVVRAKVANWKEGVAGLELEPMTIAEETEFVKFTFGRADAWVKSWGMAEPDSPRRALRDVIVLGIKGLGRISRYASVDLSAYLSKQPWYLRTRGIVYRSMKQVSARVRWPAPVWRRKTVSE
jgi:cellulose synthase (UDP-forming)